MALSAGIELTEFFLLYKSVFIVMVLLLVMGRCYRSVVVKSLLTMSYLAAGLCSQKLLIAKLVKFDESNAAFHASCAWIWGTI